jgi:Methyltransferase domain
MKATLINTSPYLRMDEGSAHSKSPGPESLGHQPSAHKSLVNTLRYFFHSITFVKKKIELRRQSVHGATLLNHEFIFTEFNRTGFLPTSFSYTHGADQGSYVGSGLLYFAIPYMLKAKTCVCIGSGGGYVPRFMSQAQVEARVEGARTILVDADRGGLGRPNYLAPNSFLRARFPEIEIVNCDSANYAAAAQQNGLKIDYLHIDGDHTYEGALSDYEEYLPLMNEKGLISFHDTDGTLPCARALADIKAMGHNVIDLSFIGSGIALIQISR